MRLILLFTFLFFATCSVEDGWQGIKVFSSTQVDVEKRLGRGRVTDGTVLYSKDDVNVSVYYSTEPCTKAGFGLGKYDLASGTVLTYTVYVKAQMKKSNLKWDEKNYDRYEDPHIRGVFHYYNSEKGIRLTTAMQPDGEEFLQRISYEPTSENKRKHLCPTNKD